MTPNPSFFSREILYYCPVCSGLQNIKSPCLNPEGCHAWLCLPVLKYYNNPLANINEELLVHEVNLQC